MACVDVETAEKVARRKALGALASLRRSIKVFKVRVGDDWLFGFVKTRFKGEGFQIAVKLVYVDCRGSPLERLPSDLEEKVRRYVEEGVASLLERELSNVAR
ncbi:hypothetical protein [Pyrobaculum neutrophilum]|uniref:Uncharacterized protein n=1 Tax=Pyrobaculum neutrophilum (strain DSM 2338 / JCM 9278 / NBRC 100436 / V24Sta) TaxID=444157 RepID=B1YDB6_PYRNV|nr:hypothetical protein [Pyrobaculum neutrophilum]ACB39779.1 conserved hypothetical protein [Pyrobaculum neutrophilum V24Sta]